jgi:hypothetical protein
MKQFLEYSEELARIKEAPGNKELERIKNGDRKPNKPGQDCSEHKEH